MAKDPNSSGVDEKAVKKWDADWSKSFDKMADMTKSLDSAQEDAMKLLTSNDPKKQAQGQKQMAEIQDQIQAISQMLKSLGDTQKAAINNLKS